MTNGRKDNPSGIWTGKMEIEASKKNLLKAQDSRRLIGVCRFLEKLQGYKQNPGLWSGVVEKFKKYGFIIEEWKK